MSALTAVQNFCMNTIHLLLYSSHSNIEFSSQITICIHILPPPLNLLFWR